MSDERILGFREEDWTARDIRVDKMDKGKMIGNTFVFCEECLGGREVGMMMGETGVFRQKARPVGLAKWDGETEEEAGAHLLDVGEKTADLADFTYCRDTCDSICSTDIGLPWDDGSYTDRTSYSECYDDCVSACMGTESAGPARMVLPDWTEGYAADRCGAPYGEDVAVAPLLNARTISDFLSIDPEVDGASVVIEGAEDYEEQLLRTAWALITQNLDLMEFALTYLRGAGDGVFERFSEHVLGETGSTVELRDSGSGFVTYLKIKINKTRSRWKNYVRIWTNESVSDSDRLCCALDLACTLAHETTHLADLVCVEDGFAGFKEGVYTELYDLGLLSPFWEWVLWEHIEKGGHCCHSYLAENIFRYCMTTRYSSALKNDRGVPSTCCVEFFSTKYDTALESHFYHDRALYCDTACLPVPDDDPFGDAHPRDPDVPPPTEPPELDDPPLGGGPGDEDTYGDW